MFLTTPGRDAAADFVGVAFGVEGEEAGEDFVAEVGGPEQAALVGWSSSLVSSRKTGAARAARSRQP